MRISDWSSDVCSSDLRGDHPGLADADIAAEFDCGIDLAERLDPRIVDALGARAAEIDDRDRAGLEIPAGAARAADQIETGAVARRRDGEAATRPHRAGPDRATGDVPSPVIGILPTAGTEREGIGWRPRGQGGISYGRRGGAQG